MLQFTIGQATGGLTPKDWLVIVGPILALIGVAVSLSATAKQQRIADGRRYRNERSIKVREKNQEIRTARGVLFAQLCRVHRTIQGEYGYLARSDLRFIWLSFYSSLLPTVENLQRTELLGPSEVIDVTAFYYSYHEQMGYIASASGGIGKTAIKFDHHMVGVDVSSARLQLKWVMDALAIIETKSLAAMDAILNAARSEYGTQDELYTKLIGEVDKSAWRYAESRPFVREVWECIRFAEMQGAP